MPFFPTWKKVLVIGLCLLGVLFALPNLLSQETRQNLPDWLPNEAVNLGLDLQGGAHLLVEVQVEEVVAERMQALRGEVREALSDAGVRRYTNLTASEDSVSVRITNAEETEAAAAALRDLSEPVGGFLGGGFGMGGGVAGGESLNITQTGEQTFRLSLSEPAVEELTARTMAQSLEIVRRRIDEAGTREPTIQRQGEDRILIQVPGVGSAEELLDLIGRTAKLTFHDVVGYGQGEATAGPGEMVVPSAEEGGQTYVVDRRAILTGENLVDAQLGFHPDTGLPVVNFRFDQRGARIFGNWTAAHVGELFAIVLDEAVVSAPQIRSPILGGAGFIEGDFTTESATNLAILLRSGALPASISVLEQRTVGPDLGADSVAAGTAATLLAFAAVLIFMGIIYRAFGLFANVALLINLALIIGVLSAIGATLTLPGIAGIVLTIGMAVDANVLIFERIREELRASKSPFRAVEKGYAEARSSIFDANITTLIAAVILFAMGSGPVKGFAVTLGIGIVTSLFTALWVTRLMTETWLRRARPKELKVERISLVPAGTRFSFMAHRRLFVGISGAAVVASIVLGAVFGFNYGIDFRGGTLVQIQTERPAQLGEIRGLVGDLGYGDVQVQSFGSERDVLIRVEERGADGDERMQIAESVGEAVKQAMPGTEIRRVEVVGPKVSGELLTAGIIALCLAVAAILVYIWLRFEWQFGVGAVLALVHDVLLTVGLFAVTQLEFNLSTIAALLTIVGYSLNDTVVIYDRVRENLRKYKKMELRELLDLSLNETLSRTVMTSVTTLIALAAMFVLGPEVIKGFTFAMIWGILVGTYSTVFMAVALLLWLGVKREWGDPAEKSKAGVQFGGAQV